MANTSHTPGPWHYSPSQQEGEFIIQGNYDNGGGPRLPILGRTHNFPQSAEANARLIAAAPEMYEALKGLDAILAKEPGYPGSPEAVKVRAVLAKAEAA